MCIEYGTDKTIIIDEKGAMNTYQGILKILRDNEIRECELLDIILASKTSKKSQVSVDDLLTGFANIILQNEGK